MDLLNNSSSSNCVDLSRFNDVEAAVPVVLIIREPAQCRPNAGVDVGIVSQQAFLARMVEICSMIDTGLLARCASKHFRLPCV
jgi:hypothetical protein